MALALTVQVGTKNRLGRGWYVEVLITPSGSYATLGDLADFGIFHPARAQPTFVTIMGKNGHMYKYDVINKKMRVFVATTTSGNAPLTEHSAAAYDASVTADVIVAQCWYMKTA